MPKKYEVVLTKQAQKGYDKLPNKIKLKCLEVLRRLKTEPNLGKQLLGALKDYRSIRLATYRIIYKKQNNKLIIYVVSIRHRKDVYDRISI